MVPQPDDAPTLTQANEETYDQLISLIENTQGRLAPIIVACDDEALRKRVIDRYESEVWEAQIRPYRIILGQEPSLRSGLETLTQQQPHLQRGGKAVFTVTGAEMLLRVKLNPQDEQSDLDKFFGYLQWTREGLRAFRYPIVLWVTYRILLELSRRSADFWSWRKAVLRFETESPSVIQNAVAGSQTLRPVEDDSDAESLPPLTELQVEIATLTAKDPDATGLATLYDRLGQVYDQRISQGLAENLEQERRHTIAAFQQAITRYQAAANQTAQMWTFTRLGNFFRSQSLYSEAIDCHQKALEIAQAIGDRDGEASSLRDLGYVYNLLRQPSQAFSFSQQALEIDREIGNHKGEASDLRVLGNAYDVLAQYEQAIDCTQQALEIDRKIGNRRGEANSLNNLGASHNSLGQHQHEIDFHQQSLKIYREIGDRHGEATALGNLGAAYQALGRHQRAIECHQESLDIKRAIGDRSGEANALFSMAIAFSKLGPAWEALQHYQHAQQIYQSVGLEYWVKQCNTAIYNLNQTIPIQPSSLERTPPVLPDWYVKSLPTPPLSASPSRGSAKPLWVYGLVGLAIVLLIWWLKR